MTNPITIQSVNNVVIDSKSWKKIAWNGIQFSVPAGWEATQIDPFHLILEDASGPTLEIKWGQVKGAFSHQQQLQQMAAQQKGRQINSCPMPPTWERALRAYQTVAFNWRTELANGKGLIIYCGVCHTVTLLQFIGKKQKNPEMTATAATILASFKDHSVEENQLWSLFDIRAQIPNYFVLTQHRFEAGEFELLFKTKGLSLWLYRWGLATMRLKEKDLFAFGEEKLAPPGADRVHLPETLFPTAEWRFTASTRFARLQCRLGSQKPYQRSRIWHLEAKDRLLCVRMAGNEPIPNDIFDDVVRHYAVIV